MMFYAENASRLHSGTWNNSLKKVKKIPPAAGYFSTCFRLLRNKGVITKKSPPAYYFHPTQHLIFERFSPFEISKFSFQKFIKKKSKRNEEKIKNKKTKKKWKSFNFSKTFKNEVFKRFEISNFFATNSPCFAPFENKGGFVAWDDTDTKYEICDV